MALVASATVVGTAIATALGTPQAAAFWIAIVTQIYSGIVAGAQVTGTATGAMGGGGGVPVVGTIT